MVSKKKRGEPRLLTWWLILGNEEISIKEGALATVDMISARSKGAKGPVPRLRTYGMRLISDKLLQLILHHWDSSRRQIWMFWINASSVLRTISVALIFATSILIIANSHYVEGILVYHRLTIDFKRQNSERVAFRFDRVEKQWQIYNHPLYQF